MFVLTLKAVCKSGEEYLSGGPGFKVLPTTPSSTCSRLTLETAWSDALQ